MIENIHGGIPLRFWDRPWNRSLSSTSLGPHSGQRHHHSRRLRTRPWIISRCQRKMGMALLFCPSWHQIAVLGSRKRFDRWNVWITWISRSATPTYVSVLYTSRSVRRSDVCLKTMSCNAIIGMPPSQCCMSLSRFFHKMTMPLTSHVRIRFTPLTQFAGYTGKPSPKAMNFLTVLPTR